MSHVEGYLAETAAVAAALSPRFIRAMVEQLVSLRRRGGRLFIIGLGGSAANASHAANDFRKLCGIEAYCLTDNAAELTAIANDEGFDQIFVRALQAAHAGIQDMLMVFSVGGGTPEVSFALVNAIDFVHSKGIAVLGIVGRDGGYTAKKATCVIVPTVNAKHVTPHTEAFQGVILHCLVSHPDLQTGATKW